jgi:hypothetical protein
MADLENPGILQKWPELVDRRFRRQLTLARLTALGTLSRSAGEGLNVFSLKSSSSPAPRERGDHRASDGG